MKEINWDYVYEFIMENRPLMKWDDIRDELNEYFKVNYSESAYRKPATAFFAGIEHAEKLTGTDKLLDSVANSRVKLKIEKAIINKERYQITQAVNKIATHELFNEEIKESIRKGYPKIEEIKIDDSDESYYMVSIADLHYKGHENLEIIFSEIESLLLHKKKELGFEHLYISELADTIEGATLRPSQLLSIKKGMVDQAMTVAKYYAQMLTNLSKVMKITFICVESSNHTQLRNLGSGRSELPTEDLMKVIGEFIEIRTENNPNIKVVRDDEVLIKINGKNFMFEHGHAIKSKEHAAKSSYYNGVLIDYIISGHEHHHEVITIQEKDGRNTKHIKVPSANVEPGNYENDNKLSSAPAILFSKFDVKKGYKYSEELFLDRSKKLVKESFKKKVKKNV